MAMAGGQHKALQQHILAREAHAEHQKHLLKMHQERRAASAALLNNNQNQLFYGDVHAPPKTVFVPGKRRRLNIVGICINAFFPFFMFATLYCAMSFKFHYQNPTMCWLIAFALFFVSVLMLVYAKRGRKRDREPAWLMFTSLSCVFAVIFATVFGNLNYVFNLLPYYEIDSLNNYPSVNPANDWGQMMMDAGRIYFADGTGIDMQKASSFKATDLYCVAPIVNGEEKMSHYDFWAVGVNCCSGVSSDFRCGQFNNPKARSGIRLLWDSQRAFYRLAVQMAAAQFQLNAPHPLFFEWIQDPVAELSHYLETGWRYYLLGISTHFAVNLIATISAMIIFSKIGNVNKGGFDGES